MSIVKRLIKMSGSNKRKLQWAIVFSFIEGIFTLSPELLVMFVVYRIATETVKSSDVGLVAILMIGSVVLRALFRRIVDGLQSGSGYEIFAGERMKIGEHLKRLPMGYFDRGAAGNITSIVTSDIVFAEQYGTVNMAKIVNAWISMILGSIMMFILDWRMALVALATFFMGYQSLKKLDKVGREQSQIRQAGFSRLTVKVLEFIKGIGVAKAFDLTGDRSDRMNREFKDFRDKSIQFETAFAKRYVIFNSWFALGIGIIVMLLSYLGIRGQINMGFVLMMMIYIFQFFTPYQVLSDVSALTRIMEAGLDRYDEVMNEPIIDAEGKNIELEHFEIEFDQVTFAYEEKKVLKNVSFKVPEKSMTALVGKSGCGKTTIVNLLARFWDVQEGQVKLGGVDVKQMTCDSLLKNISMVFQNVYLFNDTILNNIKFGRPEASMDEIVEACKKARCYDFIMAFEKGFETLVEEGGVSLSGGEKQRISIARAILKDAPIVLLDEATASVDPDNEKHIQEAINELVHHKTLLVIAHKLSTVKHADQILVLESGEIIQQGLHDTLIHEEGAYQAFWKRRTKAKSWKIQTQ